MAAKKKKADAEAPEKSKKKTIIMAVVAVAVLGGAYETVLKPKPLPAPVPAGSIATMGPVVTESAITINLADGHYLQVAPAIQLVKGATPVDVNMGAPQITNLFISSLSQQSEATLSTPATFAPIKAKIVSALSTLFPKEVSGIYFTQFVMQ